MKKQICFLLLGIIMGSFIYAQKPMTVGDLHKWMGRKTNNGPMDSTSLNPFQVNDILRTNEFLYSSNGKYKLKMQADANLCIYTADDKFEWCSMSQSKKGGYMKLQQDGNLVIYDNSDKYLWDSKTYNLASKPDIVWLSNEGKLQLIDKAGKIVWNNK